MLIIFNNLYKIINLKKIAKINNIKFYSNKTKNELIKLINQHKCSVYIQKVFRNKLSDFQSLICPITLSRLKYPFVTIKNYNVFKYYEINSFINYLNKSKEFIDPCTRNKINNNTIENINSIAKYYNLNKKVQKKNNNKKILYFNLINEINNIINLILTNELNIDVIYVEIIPKINYYFKFINKYFPEKRNDIINMYKNSLINHNSKNKYLLLNYLYLMTLNFN